VLSQYNAYVSSGYDCCVYAWSITEHRRLGALLLGRFLLLPGGDRHWELKVSEDVRKKNELDTANKGLKEVEQEKQKRSQEEKEKRKYNEKDETISHAANLIKKVATADASLRQEQRLAVNRRRREHRTRTEGRLLRNERRGLNTRTATRRHALVFGSPASKQAARGIISLLS